MAGLSTRPARCPGEPIRPYRSTPKSNRPPSGVTRGHPANGLLTTGSLASAPHAMLGVRAPAPEGSRRSDSHHGLRHDRSLPGYGEQEVKEAAATAGGSRRSAFVTSLNRRVRGGVQWCGYQSTDPGLACDASARRPPWTPGLRAAKERRAPMAPEAAGSATVPGSFGAEGGNLASWRGCLNTDCTGRCAHV